MGNKRFFMMAIKTFFRDFLVWSVIILLFSRCVYNNSNNNQLCSLNNSSYLCQEWNKETIQKFKKKYRNSIVSKTCLTKLSDNANHTVFENILFELGDRSSLLDVFLAKVKTEGVLIEDLVMVNGKYLKIVTILDKRIEKCYEFKFYTSDLVVEESLPANLIEQRFNICYDRYKKSLVKKNPSDFHVPCNPYEVTIITRFDCVENDINEYSKVENVYLSKGI